METGGLKELSRQSRQRSIVYRLLSLFFLDCPDTEFFRKLKDRRFLQNILDIAAYGPDEFREPILPIQAFLEENQGRPEGQVLETLQVDFTKLTGGIHPDGVAPPYEAVWRGSPSVDNEWTHRVLNFYARTKTHIDLEDQPPDSIGIELKFMSLLCYREMEMWEKEDIRSALATVDDENEFLVHHLLEWAPSYLEAMEEEAETSFYKGVAVLTRNFLEFDRRTTEELLDLKGST